MNHFEAASLSTSTLLVKKLGDDKQEQTIEYTLSLDFNSVAKAQEHLGRDLSVLTNWQNMTGSDTSIVCWCALDRFHPEVTLRQLRQMISPAQSAIVSNMLLEMCFPGILERIRVQLEKKAKGESVEENPTSAGKR
jgi:hypothetical protein